MFLRTIVFKINRLESALAMSKISFLRKFEKSYTCRKIFFWPNKKIRVYLMLIKNRKKIIWFKSATSTVNLIWNDPYVLFNLWISRRVFRPLPESKSWSKFYIFRYCLTPALIFLEILRTWINPYLLLLKAKTWFRLYMFRILETF